MIQNSAAHRHAVRASISASPGKGQALVLIAHIASTVNLQARRGN